MTKSLKCSLSKIGTKHGGVGNIQTKNLPALFLKKKNKNMPLTLNGLRKYGFLNESCPTFEDLQTSVRRCEPVAFCSSIECTRDPFVTDPKKRNHAVVQVPVDFKTDSPYCIRCGNALFFRSLAPEAREALFTKLDEWRRRWAFVKEQREKKEIENEK